MSEQNIDVLKNKVSEALNTETPRVNIKTEDFQRSEIKQTAKSENLAPVLNIPTREELKVDEKEILEVVKPVLVKAADLAKTTQHPDLAQKYNKVVDNAISMGWLTGNESSAIQARAEQVKKEKEEKAKDQLDKVEAKVRSLEAQVSVSSMFELNRAKSELNHIDIDGLSDDVKNKIDSVIKKIDNKIVVILEEIKQKENQVKDKQPEQSLLGLLFGQVAD